MSEKVKRWKNASFGERVNFSTGEFDHLLTRQPVSLLTYQPVPSSSFQQMEIYVYKVDGLSVSRDSPQLF